MNPNQKRKLFGGLSANISGSNNAGRKGGITLRKILVGLSVGLIVLILIAGLSFFIQTRRSGAKSHQIASSGKGGKVKGVQVYEQLAKLKNVFAKNANVNGDDVPNLKVIAGNSNSDNKNEGMRRIVVGGHGDDTEGGGGGAASQKEALREILNQIDRISKKMVEMEQLVALEEAAASAAGKVVDAEQNNANKADDKNEKGEKERQQYPPNRRLATILASRKKAAKERFGFDIRKVAEALQQERSKRSGDDGSKKGSVGVDGDAGTASLIESMVKLILQQQQGEDILANPQEKEGNTDADDDSNVDSILKKIVALGLSSSNGGRNKGSKRRGDAAAADGDGAQMVANANDGPNGLYAPIPPADDNLDDHPAKRIIVNEQRLPALRYAVNNNFPLKAFGHGNYSGDQLDFGRIHREEDGDADLSRDVGIIDNTFVRGSNGGAKGSGAFEWNPLSKLSQSRVRTGKIFVSLASFRDSECSRTVLDMFLRAKHPQRVYVGVAEQHLPADGSCVPQEFLTQACQLGGGGGVGKSNNFCPTDNIRIRQIDPLESKGPVYGRYMAQLLYRGEDYYFMLDSHTRFTEGWDVRIIEMYENLRYSDHFRTEVIYSGEEGSNDFEENGDEDETADDKQKKVEEGRTYPYGLATDAATGGDLAGLLKERAMREAADYKRATNGRIAVSNASSSSVLNPLVVSVVDGTFDAILSNARLSSSSLSDTSSSSRLPPFTAHLPTGSLSTANNGDIPNRFHYDLNGKGLFGGSSGASPQERQALAQRERTRLERDLAAHKVTTTTQKKLSEVGNQKRRAMRSSKKNTRKPRKIVLSHYPEAYAEDGAKPFDIHNRPMTAYMCKGFYMPATGIFRLEAILTSKRQIPLPQPFAAAGFLFADASLLQEVPFDPYLDYVFDGEEILYSVRMWTHGWDIFSPSESIVFHIYGRSNAPKVWSHGTTGIKTAQRKAAAEKRIQYFMRTIMRDSLPIDGSASRLAPPPPAGGVRATTTAGETNALASVLAPPSEFGGFANAVVNLSPLQHELLRNYSTSYYPKKSDGGGSGGDGDGPLAPLQPYRSSILSHNSILVVDDGLLTNGMRRVLDTRRLGFVAEPDVVSSEKKSLERSGGVVFIDESKALPWYVTAEESVYGLGSERSLEAYYEFSGLNPYTHTFKKDWCTTFA